MQPLTRLVFLLGMLALFFGAACGGNPPEEIAQVSSAIQSTCLKPANDPAAVWPWDATWPIGSQHVFCLHMPAETASSTWPAGVSRCPADGTHAGARQVDVWVADSAPKMSFYCARVTLAPAPARFALDYEPFLEMGWLSSSVSSSRTRQMTGVWVGPGSSVVVESRATANPLGCAYPFTDCASVQVPSNGVTTWMPVSGFKADAVNFY